MKICRITSEFVPPWKGLGPGPYELSRAQVRAGHELVVITKYAEGAESFDSQAEFKIHRIKAKHDIVFCLLASIKFLLINSKEKFDLVHGHIHSAIFLLFLKKLFLLKTPIVNSVHIIRKKQCHIMEEIYRKWQLCDYFGLDSLKKLSLKNKNKKELLYERLYLKLTDMLFVVNTCLADDIAKEYGIRDNVKVIYNGVNPSDFKADRNKGFSEDSHSISILFVGVLNGRKGEFDLINAMKPVVDTFSNAKLTIIGDGPTKLAAKELAVKSGLESHIEFLDIMEPSDLKKRYAACDLFILPSYSEGLPKVLLEALSCGSIVIASDIDAHTGLIDNGITGYTFETGNPESLCSAILNALQHDSYTHDNIITNAMSVIEKEYSWDAVAKRIDQGYDIILKQNQSNI